MGCAINKTLPRPDREVTVVITPQKTDKRILDTHLKMFDCECGIAVFSIWLNLKGVNRTK